MNTIDYSKYNTGELRIMLINTVRYAAGLPLLRPKEVDIIRKRVRKNKGERRANTYESI